MKFKFNVPGNKRKELATTIASWLALDVKDAGAPTFAYEIGNIKIEKDGTAIFPNITNADIIEMLLEHLYDEGFESEMIPV